MRLKSELYKTEQEEIVDQIVGTDKIIGILGLDKDKSITLYELDNDEEKQKKIMGLSINIRKYFTYTSIIGVKKKLKRPWLSIIKNVCKLKYRIEKKDKWMNVDGKGFKTTKYTFNLI